MSVVFKDLWTGKHGIELSVGTWRFISIGFGDGIRWRWKP